ncbi:MAG: O-antigen ligase family protein [Planctomycetales bacterium]|jgi:O-antigen ligase
MAKPKRSSRNSSSNKARNTRKFGLADEPLHPASGGPAGIVWGLLLARWLIPTEGTAEGESLWLTSSTLAAAAGFFWWKSRVSFERLRFEKLDVAVWFLCGAHVLSSLIVILTEGNKRAATNMLWEWLAIAVTFSIIRQTVTSQSRAAFLQTVLVVTTALACYGIWQPTFWYPSNLREYENLKAEIHSVESSSEMSSQEREKRQRELRVELVSRGIPLSGRSLQLFEHRLRDSQEPLGFFALTNTLASFMTIAVVLLTGTLLSLLLRNQAGSTSSISDGLSNRGILCTLTVALLLVAYCLVLTKSRSAWGGTVVGLGTLIGLFAIRSKSGATLRKLLPIVLIGAVILSLLSGVAIATGALDIEVLTEATMSLSYRLEYWTSTWDVILDHPLFGTGPGNFRDNYLRHKLPQSSEEIADPHQFILDVTANAGLVGLVGLLGFLAVVAWLSWKLCRPTEDVPDADVASAEDSDLLSQGVVRTAIGVAAAVTVAGEWLFSGSVAWSVLSVCLLAAVIGELISIVLKRSSDSAASLNALCVPSIAVVSAVVAVLVHLSAAGGIAMPAVIGVILALAAVIFVDASRGSTASNGASPQPDTMSTDSDGSTQVSEDDQNVTWLAAGLFSGLAAVGCTMTAFGPVMTSTSILRLGDYEAINGQPTRQVVSQYRRAAKADTLSADPYIRLSQSYLHQWKQTGESSFFDQSIEHAQKARTLSPHSPQVAHAIGYAWLVRARGTSRKDQNAIASAVTELQNTFEMYPTNPTWTAETAQALAMAGESDKASEMAHRAFKLDEINRGAGHSDRYLSDELLADVRRMIIE